MSLPNTHYGAEYIGSLFEGEKKTLFFAGIGGVSMCSLAYISKLRGHTVSGYDRTPSKTTRELESKGISVYYENDVSHMDGVDILIYTVAIPKDTPEYKYALENSIPCISRADYLGYLMSSYKNSIGVSGMHGKSTTTSMLEKIFVTAGCDPTVSCGATMLDTGCAHRIGSDEFFIFEACEYMDSFLDFYPTLAVILNIELDHVDYFHSMEQIEESYGKFADKTGKGGTVVANICDDNVMRAVKNYGGHLVTFGVESGEADYSAQNITFENGRGRFDIFENGKPLCKIKLNVFGAHSVADALAAAAAAHRSGISPDKIEKGLALYEGAARRMEFSGMTKKGAVIYNDYAHHPTEIETTLAAAAEFTAGKLFCIFQPHTYSRTSELFDSFVKVLSDSRAYEIVLSPIYSARETDTLGVSSEMLAERIRENSKKASCFEDFTDISYYIAEKAEKDDVVVVMGAGDIPAVINMMK